MSIKVVITGSSGVLGRAVYNAFSSEEHIITYGLVFRRSMDPKKISVDLTDETSTFFFLDSIKPDLVIHCAAERRPDVVSQDPTNAFKLNVGSTNTISKWANENNSKMLYISSDYVFDGQKPPYHEEDTPNPLNDYGKSKFQSEQLVLQSNPKNIILRLPILYGNVEYIEETAVTILLKSVRDNSAIARMSNYERRFPTHCDDVALVILNLVKQWVKKPEDICGIFHYQSEEEMTKLDMAFEMGKIFSLSTDHIVAEDLPKETDSIKRPYKSELSCSKLKKMNLYHQPRLFSAGIMDSLKIFLK